MEANALTALSDAMVRAAQVAGSTTVRVDGRKGLSASGVVYAPGWVLAAHHAVERKEGVRVELPDGTQVEAQAAGRDPASDLVLLRLNGGGNIPAAEPAPIEARVGQFVLALGRPSSEGLQASLGVVGAVGGPLHSAEGRLLERFIRTDAIPYPGFSGGPLVDGDGRVLGINTSGFAPGASLAVPASTAWQVAQALSQYGRMRRGFLGIRSQAVDLPPGADAALGRRQERGLLLVGVERGQPADRAGLMVGDILVGVDGTALEDHDSLVRRLAGNVAGSTVSAEILRGGRLTRFSVQVGEKE